jgi:hypothetical protein
VSSTKQLQDAPINVKLVLSALWVAMLFIFAYVDIFGFFREDVLDAALDGEVATTGLAVNQVFLVATLVYIALPALMVVGSLVLRPRVNRPVNIVVSLVYLVTILVSCIGETWIYYLLGSLIEAAILFTIALTAWRWPST